MPGETAVQEMFEKADRVKAEVYEAASRITAALINAGYIKRGGDGEIPLGPKKDAVKEAINLFRMVHEELKTNGPKPA